MAKITHVQSKSHELGLRPLRSTPMSWTATSATCKAPWTAS